jgi:2,3-bisphosphoglycerate-independent phosphoglycerate mutase
MGLKDDVKKFDEISCGQGLDGLLGRFSAIHIMPTAIKYRDKFN